MEKNNQVKVDNERGLILDYAANNPKNFSKNEEHFFYSLVNRGIEKEPALILAIGASNFWNPKKMVTTRALRKVEEIEHDYGPLVSAYDSFRKKDYPPITSAFLAVNYVTQRENATLEAFEETFKRRRDSLSDLLE